MGCRHLTGWTVLLRGDHTLRAIPKEHRPINTSFGPCGRNHPTWAGFIRHGRGYRAESGNDAGGNEGARSRLWHGVSRAVSRPDARYLRFEVERGHSACMRACKEVVRGPWQLEIRTGWETPANG